MSCGNRVERVLAECRFSLIGQVQALMTIFQSQNSIHNKHANDRRTTAFPRVYSGQVRVQLPHGATEDKVIAQGSFDLTARVQDRAVIPAAEVRTDLLQGQRR